VLSIICIAHDVSDTEFSPPVGSMSCGAQSQSSSLDAEACTGRGWKPWWDSVGRN